MSNKVGWWDEWGDGKKVRWYKTLAILLSTYKKLLKLMEIWRSSDRNSLRSFMRHGIYNIMYYIVYNYSFIWIIPLQYKGLFSEAPKPCSQIKPSNSGVCTVVHTHTHTHTYTHTHTPTHTYIHTHTRIYIYNIYI